MWPYCGHFQLHRQFWSLNWIGNCWLNRFVNYKDCCFKFQRWSSAAKVIGGQSWGDHIGPPNCVHYIERMIWWGIKIGVPCCNYCSSWELELGAWRKIHFRHNLSTWELEGFTGLTMLRWCLDGSYVECIQRALGKFWRVFRQNPKLPPWGSLGSVKLKLSFCGPKPMGFQALFGFVMNFFLFLIIPLISHLEYYRFTLVWTTLSLKIGEALNSLSFGWNPINSKYWTPKIGISSSQFEH